MSIRWQKNIWLKRRNLVKTLKTNLAEYPDLFYAGYTQDAFKEYAEARLVNALAQDEDLPWPEELGVEPSTYMLGSGRSLRRIAPALPGPAAPGTISRSRTVVEPDG